MAERPKSWRGKASLVPRPSRAPARKRVWVVREVLFAGLLFWILDSGFWILDSGFWILDSSTKHLLRSRLTWQISTSLVLLVLGPPSVRSAIVFTYNDALV